MVQRDGRVARCVALVGGALLACGAVVACQQEPEPVPTGGLTITGTVLLPSGEPCACGVGLSSPDHTLPEIGQLTDSTGAFAWSVPGPGEFTVEAASADGSAARTVVVTDRDVHVTLTLDPATPGG